MWDFITMVPTFWSIMNAVNWTDVFAGLFIASEALAAIPWIKANGVFQAIYNFLMKYKQD